MNWSAVILDVLGWLDHHTIDGKLTSRDELKMMLRQALLQDLINAGCDAQDEFTQDELEKYATSNKQTFN